MIKKLTFIFLSILALSANQVFAEQMDELSIISDSVILMDSQSNAVLYSKNEHERMYPASLTKIATAIYAIQTAKINEVVKVSSEAIEVEGTKVYLNEGEEVTLEKLIQGMLINSGNDAAAAIALYIDGSIENYEKNINEFLQNKVGVKDTHFTNPHGLFDENHYTTAYDLGLITNYALKNEIFKEIFGTKDLAWDGQSWDTTLFTHHLLLKGEIPFEGITGGKTGFVNESRQTLATTASNGQIGLTVIGLGATYKRDIYNDTINLLSFGFSNYKTSTIPVNTTFENIKDKYVVTDPLYITEPITGSAILDVTKEGELAVFDSSNKELQTISLAKYKLKTAPDKASIIGETTSSDESTPIMMKAISIGLGFALLGAFIGMWKKRILNG
ncbi:D-alanyl-D-alanine carboxypeptidase [Robertmurraya korlensis]|uniref:D-alanyl-D-alanine carboxypeptidase family protein n=1 Tax=Robertmurraya korlensis TaxID=519977 RepID=UPI00203BA744|nr:D-alanyl-D-alanine carboxypeptidase [Robertmurraya korlensis]